jgi:hypothetical protein
MNPERIHRIFTPDNCMAILIDYQLHFAFTIDSLDFQPLINTDRPFLFGISNN